MTVRKRNQKMVLKKKRSPLLLACMRRGLTVSDLAALIGSPRNMCYLAWEKPTRYSRTFQKIQNALSL